jgi:hypothetical protein
MSRITPTCRSIPWRRVTHLLLGRTSPDSYILHATVRDAEGEQSFPIEPFDGLVDALISSLSYFESRNKRRVKKMKFKVTDDVFEDCCRLHVAGALIEKYKLHTISGIIRT